MNKVADKCWCCGGSLGTYGVWDTLCHGCYTLDDRCHECGKCPRHHNFDCRFLVVFPRILKEQHDMLTPEQRIEVALEVRESID